MSYLLYILLGIAPSIIWLSFYLRKDVHPEPKKLILKVFVLGMLAAILAAFIENLIFKGFYYIPLPFPILEIIYIFLGVALIEELLKYQAVDKKYVILKNGIIQDTECDEPTDLMIYMIVAALGFAALENILIFSLKNLPVLEIFLVASLRFIGATFLHALCSGAFGFFIALSFLQRKKRICFLTAGITIATLLHGIFNYSIIRIERSIMIENGQMVIVNFNSFLGSFFCLIAVLLGLSIFVAWAFKKLRNAKSICLS